MEQDLTITKEQTDCETSSKKRIFKDLSKIYKPKRDNHCTIATVYDNEIYINTSRFLKGKKVRNGMIMTRENWEEFKSSIDKLSTVVENSFYI